MSNERDQGIPLPTLTRRVFVKTAGVFTALGAASPGSVQAREDELQRLSEDSDMATALGYKHDAQTVDAAVRASDRYCFNCALFAGAEDEAWAGCSIFPGKAVAGRGWCSVWSPRP